MTKKRSLKKGRTTKVVRKGNTKKKVVLKRVRKAAHVQTPARPAKAGTFVPKGVPKVNVADVIMRGEGNFVGSLSVPTGRVKGRLMYGVSKREDREVLSHRQREDRCEKHELAVLLRRA